MTALTANVMAQPAPATPAPDIVASVNDQKLTRDDLAELAITLHGPQIIQLLIHHEIIRQEAEKQGVIVSPEEMRAYVEETVEFKIRQEMTQFGMASVEVYAAQLDKIGQSLDARREGMRKQLAPRVWYELASHKLIRKTITVRRRIRAQPGASQRCDPDLEPLPYL